MFKVILKDNVLWLQHLDDVSRLLELVSTSQANQTTGAADLSDDAITEVKVQQGTIELCP